jgi:hypothetical protein
MADSSNPVSPKVVAAGLGGVIVVIVTAALSFLQSPGGEPILAALPAWASYILPALATIVTAVIAGYSKTDPLRLPTVESAAVDELNT